MFLGTLLSEILSSLTDQVTFKEATISSDHKSFSLVAGLQSAYLIADSTLCNPDGNFPLTVTYDLAPSTQEVVSVIAKGFGTTSTANWYESAVSHEDNLSSPPHGYDPSEQKRANLWLTRF